MGQATALLAKTNSILNKYMPLDRTVYLRTLSAETSADDDLIGNYASAPTDTDVLLDPQPYYERIGREHVPGGHAQSFDIIGTSGTTTVLADDYNFLFSASSVSRTTLQSVQNFIALKDASGNTEVLRLLDVIPYGMESMDVVFVAYYRSIQRSSS